MLRVYVVRIDGLCLLRACVARVNRLCDWWYGFTLLELLVVFVGSVLGSIFVLCCY